jgi:transposase-like protein
MPHIVAGVLSLAQHIKIHQHPSKMNRPSCCPYCGKSNVWAHGDYPRKSDRATGEFNPILIPRFFCPNCQKTCSALPECIPPRRWYMWYTQQLVLLDLLLGKSLNSVSQTREPSRSTCRRWWERLKEQFLLHRDALCGHLNELGRSIDFSDFWKHGLFFMSLDRAMLLCHVAGVAIP